MTKNPTSISVCLKNFDIGITSGKGSQWLISALQTIAAYLRVHLGRLAKLQGKVVTHFCEVEWWRTLMVECVTVF